MVGKAEIWGSRVTEAQLVCADFLGVKPGPAAHALNSGACPHPARGHQVVARVPHLSDSCVLPTGTTADSVITP